MLICIIAIGLAPYESIINYVITVRCPWRILRSSPVRASSARCFSSNIRLLTPCTVFSNVDEFPGQSL